MNFSGKDGLAMPTPFFVDLVREMCQEGGTGPLTPSGAVPGHRRFAGAVPADTRFHYAVAGVAQPGPWETGLGRTEAGGGVPRDRDRKSTRLNSSHKFYALMSSSACKHK